MFNNKIIELWNKGSRTHIGGGVYKDSDPILIQQMEVDIQPFSKEEALKEYGYTVDCTDTMFCDISKKIKIDKTFIIYNQEKYSIQKIIEWDSYMEIVLNRM